MKYKVQIFVIKEYQTTMTGESLEDIAKRIAAMSAADVFFGATLVSDNKVESGFIVPIDTPADGSQ